MYIYVYIYVYTYTYAYTYIPVLLHYHLCPWFWHLRQQKAFVLKAVSASVWAVKHAMYPATVCIYTCINIYMRVCVRICIYIHTYIRVYACISVPLIWHLDVYMYTYAYVLLETDKDARELEPYSYCSPHEMETRRSNTQCIYPDLSH